MSNKRTTYTSEFKAKIAILALSEKMTIAEISSKFEVNATQICKWKKELQERSKEIFEDKGKKDEVLTQKESELDRLYRQLGQITVENDWLKKKSALFAIGK